MKSYIGNLEDHRFSLAFSAVPTRFQTKTEGVIPIRDMAAGQPFQNCRCNCIFGLLNFLSI